MSIRRRLNSSSDPIAVMFKAGLFFKTPLRYFLLEGALSTTTIRPP